eukprot:gene8048-9899_t
MNDHLFQIKAIIIIDANNGNRICSTFYDQDLKEFSSETGKRNFEKALYEKSKNSNCELELIDKYIAVGHKFSDVIISVVGLNSVNEIALLDVLNVLLNCLRKICLTEESSSVNKKALLDNFSTLKLYIDEIICDGIVFEVDEETIINRTPLSENGITDINNAIELAKEKFSLFTSEGELCFNDRKLIEENQDVVYEDSPSLTYNDLFGGGGGGPSDNEQDYYYDIGDQDEYQEDFISMMKSAKNNFYDVAIQVALYLENVFTHNIWGYKFEKQQQSEGFKSILELEEEEEEYYDPIRNAGKSSKSSLFDSYHLKTSTIYRPLSIISYRLNYLMTKLNPISYHLTNVLLHYFISTYVLFLSLIIFSFNKNYNNGGRTTTSGEDGKWLTFKEKITNLSVGDEVCCFLSALLFSIHPINSGTVSGIQGRSELLSTTFYLVSILFYMKSSRLNSTNFRYYTISIVSFIAAILSKESSISLVLFIPICDLLLLYYRNNLSTTNNNNNNSTSIFPQTLKQLFLFIGRVLGFLIASMVYIYLRGKLVGGVDKNSGDLRIIDNIIAGDSGSNNQVLSILYLNSQYLWRLVFPLKLSFEWGYNCLPISIHSVNDYRNIQSLITITLLLVLVSVSLIKSNILQSIGQSILKSKNQRGVIRKVKLSPSSIITILEYRSVILCLALFLIVFLPFSNIFYYTNETFKESELYLPSIIFSMIFSRLITLPLNNLLNNNNNSTTTTTNNNNTENQLIPSSSTTTTTTSTLRNRKKSNKQSNNSDNNDDLLDKNIVDRLNKITRSIGIEDDEEFDDVDIDVDEFLDNGNLENKSKKKNSKNIKKDKKNLLTSSSNSNNNLNNKNTTTNTKKINTSNNNGSNNFSLYSLSLIVIVLVISSIFSYKTFTRNYDWKTEKSLFFSGLDVCPNSAKLHFQGGLMYKRNQDWNQSRIHFKTAKKIYPDYCEVDFNIGISNINKDGDYNEAISYLNQSLDCRYTSTQGSAALTEIFEFLIQNSPNNSKILSDWASIEQRFYPSEAATHYYQAGIIDHGIRKFESSINYFLKSLSLIDPNDDKSRELLCQNYIWIAGSYLNINQNISIDYLEKTVQNCQDKKIYNEALLSLLNLKYMIYKKQQPTERNPELVYEIATLMEKEPSYKESSVSLYLEAGKLYESINNLELALDSYEKVRALSSNNNGGKNNLIHYKATLFIAGIYFKQGDINDAVNLLESTPVSDDTLEPELKRKHEELKERVLALKLNK